MTTGIHQSLVAVLFLALFPSAVVLAEETCQSFYFKTKITVTNIRANTCTEEQKEDIGWFLDAVYDDAFANVDDVRTETEVCPVEGWKSRRRRLLDAYSGSNSYRPPHDDDDGAGAGAGGVDQVDTDESTVARDRSFPARTAAEEKQEDTERILYINKFIYKGGGRCTFCTTDNRDHIRNLGMVMAVANATIGGFSWSTAVSTVSTNTFASGGATAISQVHVSNGQAVQHSFSFTSGSENFEDDLEDALSDYLTNALRFQFSVNPRSCLFGTLPKVKVVLKEVKTKAKAEKASCY